MALKSCPACGHDAVFVPLIPAVGYDGALYGPRSEGFCNSPKCDQLLWYYPKSGRITRRTVGITLQDYWLRRADINTFNTIRGRARLPLVIEEPIAVLTLPAEVDPDAFKYAEIACPYVSWYEQVNDTIVDWYYWLLAAVTSPFKKDGNDD